MELKRSSGILQHITSLPGNYGIGTLGEEAFTFANTLKQAGMSYWQILPIGPVHSSLGYSPYSSTSTFAGNYLFISLEMLAGENWFSRDIPPFEVKDDNNINFSDVEKHKLPILLNAYDDFKKNSSDVDKSKFQNFCDKSKYWLDDFSQFSAIAEHFNSSNWLEWESNISKRQTNALNALCKKLREKISFQKFIQYIFFKQWKNFKDHCNKTGISLIGDIPIYITLESSDAWSHPEILQLDKRDGKPISVSGVPPDYFSETGQRWGNPLYKWGKNKLNSKTFNWWVNRISHINSMVDFTRIDHFRGFEGYWSIPSEEKTAINGQWIKGPGIKFFNKLKKRLGSLPLIAEDLGVITADVEKLRDDLGLPGMKILQFAFDFDNRNFYLPHNYASSNFIAYTGTHDNNTTNGWFYGKEVDDNRRKYILKYLGSDEYDDFHWQLIRQAYRTIAKVVIFPTQDILGYGEEFRMNRPGTANNNWTWKLKKGSLNSGHINRLNEMGRMYDRIREE
ncbi:4-alpha-glucanotransferase [Spirochaetota bacterium]